MKSTSLIAIGFAASILLSAQLNLKAATEGGMKFDALLKINSQRTLTLDRG
jgi:hypothetical protein